MPERKKVKIGGRNMALLAVSRIIEQHKTEGGVPEVVIDRISSHEELLNIQGTLGVFTERRISLDYVISKWVCVSSCSGKICYSNNPGCKIEELYPVIKGKYWNLLL